MNRQIEKIAVPLWIPLLACLSLASCVSTKTCALPDELPSERAHLFYYSWYGNPQTDGVWDHWNHPIAVAGAGHYEPPESIGANFYPQLGLYSSNSREDLAAQMRQIRDAGIGVLSLSWWGQGSYTDKTFPLIFELAEEVGLKINFHIEPYQNRTPETMRETLAYLLERHGSSPALYRDPARGNRTMVYVYDSYLVQAEDWATILSPTGANTIRGTALDTIVIALFVKEGDETFVSDGGFDGCYTYFAPDGFTYGSTPANWSWLARWAKANGKLFIPSVAPGYDDTRIRPWNGVNQRGRESGAYYDRMFESAIAVEPEIVSITSFNEWHEGTQIEPAIPKSIPGYTYLDYGTRAPDYYLIRTREWIERFLATQD